jgi:hypothetical protein
MTVEELIRYLSCLDPQTRVYTPIAYEGGLDQITSVNLGRKADGEIVAVID